MQKGLIFAFDLETTSVKPETTTPVQICLMSEYQGTRRILMNSLVRPGEAIQAGAREVHGISDEMTKGAPDYAMAAWTAHLLGQQMGPEMVVTYNGKLFDQPILDRCLGTPVFPGVTHIDVLDVAYRFFPGLSSHRLGNVYMEFFNKPLDKAHDASADVAATLDLLKAIRVKIGMTLEQLAEDMATPKPYAVFPFGQHRGKLLQDVDRGWAIWALKSFGKMRPDLELSLRMVVDGTA